jgi:hypothetical protein
VKLLDEKKTEVEISWYSPFKEHKERLWLFTKKNFHAATINLIFVKNDNIVYIDAVTLCKYGTVPQVLTQSYKISFRPL